MSCRWQSRENSTPHAYPSACREGILKDFLKRGAGKHLHLERL